MGLKFNGKATEKNITSTLKPLFLLLLFSAFTVLDIKAQDTIPPVLTLNPSSTGCIEMNCSNPPWVDPGATAMDNVDGNVTSRIIVTGTVDTRKIGTYTITYSVTDNANNTTTKTRTVCVMVSKSPIGFNIVKKASDFLFCTYKYSSSRSGWKWYVDGKYLKGADDVDTLPFYFDDTLTHEICMDQFYCMRDTPVRFCRQIKAVPAYGIFGTLFVDKNKNCSYDTSERGVYMIPVRLLDSADNLIAVQYSYINGVYHFSDSIGKFKVEIDTVSLPINIECTYPGKDSIVELKKGNRVVKNIDFGLSCKPVFDLMAIYCNFQSTLRPGGYTDLNARVGDITWRHNLNCQAAIACKVKLTVTGKVTCTGIPNGAITPDSIQGNTFIYMVQDLNQLDPYRAFGLIFKTDTNATTTDSVVANLTVIKNGDTDPSNNTFNVKRWVNNSKDPNFKEVYPVNVAPNYNDWLTYTVHFQNTGNAEAYHIKIRDTLDEKLDVETFEVLGASHPMQPGMKGRALVFNFPDIMLADSASDEPHSHGYVVYRVKPDKNLPAGTKIRNTAFIYFDYNDAIVTNTSINEYKALPVSGIQKQNIADVFSLYPNPNTGMFTILCNKANASVEIYNLYGTTVYKGTMPGSLLNIDLSTIAKGYYFVKIKTGHEEFYKGWIKQ